MGSFLDSSRLEDEYREPFTAWSKAKTPEATATLLKAVDPVLRAAAKRHVGSDDPLIHSRARRMAIDSFSSYDPQRAGLRTHLSQQLQGLKRQTRKANNILSVPERVSLGRSRLDNLSREMEHELGRSPSYGELSERAALPLKTIRRWLSYAPPVAEGTIAAASPTGEGVELSAAAVSSRAWRDLVYGELDPLKQSIVDLHEKGLSNEQIASRLRRTPSAISQQKVKIQRLFDREDELSPF